MNQLAIYSPTVEDDEGLFPALLAGIKAFRARVEDESAGSDRSRLLRLKAHPGTVANVAKAVLETLVDIIAWLRDAMSKLELWIGQIDALFAVIELLGAGLQGLASVLGSVRWPDALPVEASSFEPLAEIATTVAGLSQFEPPKLVPRTETLTAIVEEAAALVGKASPETTGSLHQLLGELTQAAPAPDVPA